MTVAINQRDPIADRLQALLASGVGVPDGLEAAADECGRTSSASALRSLAERMRRGERLFDDAPESRRWAAIACRDGNEAFAGKLPTAVAEMSRIEDLRQQLKWIPLGLLILCTLGSTVGGFGMVLGWRMRTEIVDEWAQMVDAEMEGLIVLISGCLLFAIFLTALGWIIWFGRAVFRLGWLDRLAWWIPIIGPAERDLDAAAATRSLAQLSQCQLPAADVYRLSNPAVSSIAFRRWLERAATDEERGAGLAMAAYSFPGQGSFLRPLVLGATAIKDRSAAWQLAADYYEDSARHRIELARAISPTLSYLTGGVIALWGAMLPLLVMSLLLNLVGSLGGGAGIGSGGRVGVVAIPLGIGLIFTIPTVTVLAIVWTIRRSWYKHAMQRKTRRKLDLCLLVSATTAAITVPMMLVPPFLGFPLCFAMGAAALILILQQRRADRLTALRAIGLAIRENGPLPQIASELGKNRVDVLGAQLLQFADGLERGQPLGEACRVAGLAEAEFLTSAQSSSASSVDSTMKRMLVALIYQKGVLITCSFCVVPILIFIVPTLQKMLEEFGMANAMFESRLVWLNSVMRFGTVLPICLIPIGLFAFAPSMWPILPGLRQWWQYGRARVLRQAAAEIRDQRSLGPDRWYCPISLKPSIDHLQASLARGTPPVEALIYSGIVRPSEGAWVKASQTSGRSAEVLEYLAGQIERNAQLWLTRLINFFWGMNLLLVTVLVFLVCTMLFGVLLDILLKTASWSNFGG